MDLYSALEIFWQENDDYGKLNSVFIEHPMILRITITWPLYFAITEEIMTNTAVFDFNKTRCNNKMVQY